MREKKKKAEEEYKKGNWSYEQVRELALTQQSIVEQVLQDLKGDGVKIGCTTKMPLAKQAGDVSGVNQDIGQGLFTQG